MIVNQATQAYRGMDRGPLGPFSFYTPEHGFLQQVIDFFDQHSVKKGSPLNGAAVNSLAAAQSFVRAWNLEGTHEVLEFEVTPLTVPASGGEWHGVVLGFDVAYCGGDFYSAIRNGLFCNPSPVLLEAYLSQLNTYGLFDERERAVEYLDAFLRESLTETQDPFVVYEVCLVDREVKA